MSSLGKADLLIVPKFDGLGAKVNSALGKVDTTPSGSKMGRGVSDGISRGLGGLVGSGAIVGAFSAVTSKAMDLVASHVGDAASRLDTLKNYPRVMESLGVGSQEASASIQTMSDRLSDLPTRLDDMAATTQGLYAATKDYGVSLTKATDAGLGLNDMLLAGGQDQAVVNSAMEQFRQMLSKGKPDMQDWKALLSAAPGQMDQLAKSMLGPTANANDLYAALGGGGAKATISMGQLLDAIIQLDQQGGEGFASFRDQAVDATGGIQTAADNFSNAWTKGIAKVMDAIGRENIVGAINVAKDATNGFFDVIAGGAKVFSDGIRYFDDGESAARRLSDAVQGMSGPIGGAAGSFDAFGRTAERAMSLARESQERATEAHHAYLDQLSESASAIEEANSRYQTQAASLEYAGQVIDSYAGKTGLSVAQQQELKSAIDTVNGSCGTQYQVMENGSGVIDANTGEVQDNTRAIWDNIRAREASAKAEAMQASKMEQDKVYAAAANEFQAQKKAAEDSAVAVQALVDKYGSVQAVISKMGETDSLGRVTADARQAQTAWSGFKQSADALREADQAQRQAAQSSRELAAETAALEARASGAELTVSQLALTTDVAMQAFNEGGAKAALSIEDFGAALEAASANDDALRTAMGDPATMAEIVAAYDGTASSLQRVLDDLGVGFDEAGAKAADAGGTISQMGDWLSNLGDDAYAAFALMGVSSDELALGLSNAGISMEQLNAIGSESFSAMAASAGGSIDNLIAMIGAVNATGIDPKELHVTDNGEIADQQGRVLDLDSMTFRQKDVTITDNGTAASTQGAADRVSGAVNGIPRTANVTVTADVGSALSGIGSVSSALANIAGRTVTTFIDQITTQHAAGGVVAHAAGGVRTHADGAIYTAPTFIGPRDVIGEAGAEYYDGEHIVPLTNRRYSQPFVDLIADGVMERARVSNAQLAAEVRALHDDLGRIIEAHAPSMTLREWKRVMA